MFQINVSPSANGQYFLIKTDSFSALMADKVLDLNIKIDARVRNWDFFSLARGAVGLNNLMKISLALVTFSLPRLHFHWPGAPGQLLRSQTGRCCH